MKNRKNAFVWWEQQLCDDNPKPASWFSIMTDLMMINPSSKVVRVAATATLCIHVLYSYAYRLVWFCSEFNTITLMWVLWMYIIIVVILKSPFTKRNVKKTLNICYLKLYYQGFSLCLGNGFALPFPPFWQMI